MVCDLAKPRIIVSVDRMFGQFQVCQPTYGSIMLKSMHVRYTGQFIATILTF
jgi:hypothetical protein